MTHDPLAGTPLGAAPTPDGMTGFGVAEFSFLASLGDSPEATLSRAFLGLKEADETIALCGASGLTSRGWLDGDGADGLAPRSFAALVHLALTRGYRWTRIGVLSHDETPGVVYVVQSSDLIMMAEPSAVASWWTRFGDDPALGADLVTQLVETRLAEHPDSACIVDSRGLEPVRHNLLVSRAADGTLACFADAEPGGVAGTPLDLPPGGLSSLVAALMETA